MCQLYTKQKIEVLRPHKNFCGPFKFSNWLNYLDRLILLDFHNILQDTFVGATSTPYKKLRSSGRTKTFAAHSKFQIWLNYLDRLIRLDFHNILEDTSVGATSTPYKKLRLSSSTKTFVASSKFTHLSYTVICICTYQDISLYGQLYMLYTAWYFNFLQMRFIQNYIIHYIARVLAAICQYSLTELISADMLRFYFMFFIKCLRQNSDIGHIFATMPCPFICINRCALPFSTRLWLNDDVIDTSSVLAISLVQVF